MDEYIHIDICIKDVALEALGPQLRKVHKLCWWDKEEEDNINREKEIYQNLLQYGDEHTTQQYKT